MMAPRRSTSRSVIGYGLGFLGVLWVMGTLALEAMLHLRGLPEMPRHLVYASLTMGAGIGWWGFFWADSKRAKDGGGFLVSARERWVRAGRRETDPVAVVTEPAPSFNGPLDEQEIPPLAGQ